MKPKPKSPARYVAPIILAAAVVVLIVVITSSLSGGDDQPAKSKKAAKQEKAVKGSGDKFYFVQPGDNLSSIANKEGLDLDELERLNPDLDPQSLSTGQRVRLR